MGCKERVMSRSGRYGVYLRMYCKCVQQRLVVKEVFVRMGRGMTGEMIEVKRVAREKTFVCERLLPCEKMYVYKRQSMWSEKEGVRECERRANERILLGIHNGFSEALLS